MWLEYCTSLVRFSPFLSFSWWLCVSVRLCNTPLLLCIFFSNTFLLWLPACCCVVTCKAEVCHIQTYNNRQIHAYSRAHAHASTPKGLIITAALYLARPHTVHKCFNWQRLEEDTKVEVQAKKVKLKIRARDTKESNCSHFMTGEFPSMWNNTSFVLKLFQVNWGRKFDETKTGATQKQNPN